MNFGPDATDGPITVLMAVSDTIVATMRTVTSTDGLNAYSVKIAYRALDVASITATLSLAASSIATSSVPHSSTTASTSASASPSNIAYSGSHQTGLSTSAKIDIGVAVPTVVLLGILGLFCIMKRRKRPQKNMETAGAQEGIIQEKYGQPRSEMDGIPEVRHEIYGVSRSELDASQSVRLPRRPLALQELPGL